ncbi:hypothetical protein [Maritimibacter sp. UBA3975]|mgnify:CR=1 FL=1|uniref:hypothetical protein n=1 Tax=Maritimibacter sp. UBA3975 TaxID=1946833 RepID=UPI000C0ADB12|nr:hypothetical protein [Maritimibacter sp. UBA3975]MAM61406.1 hypothetical protein [Maritimibacter sp.]|tara:strand:+ start:58852 stop:59340 length:489 start_codon:yes stop_codon:yes gene_type:complete
MYRLLTALMFVLPAIAATADPLPLLAGDWTGSGTAREVPEAELDAVRCRITNSYAPERLELTMSGMCVTAGRRLDLSGTIRARDDSAAISGRWSNPDGLGEVRIAGHSGEDFVAFTYSAKDPATGRQLDQNVELRLVGNGFRMRSVDRADRSVSMSDITFTR